MISLNVRYTEEKKEKKKLGSISNIKKLFQNTNQGKQGNSKPKRRPENPLFLFNRGPCSRTADNQGVNRSCHAGQQAIRSGNQELDHSTKVENKVLDEKNQEKSTQKFLKK